MASPWLLVALFAVAQADAPAQSTSSSSSELAGRVRRLVQQLDDAQLANREAAEQALVDLGPEALGLLPQVTRQTSAEVKERLGRVAQALENAAAEKVSQPTRVTLKGKMSLDEAMTALQTQSGNKVSGYDVRRGASLDLNLEDVTYWEALDAVLDQAGLAINPYGGEPNALTAAAKPDEQRDRASAAAYAGLFRVEATRVEAQRDLRNPAVTGMRIHLETTWEPRLTPISLSQPLSALTATTDAGERLPLENSEAEINVAARADLGAVEFDIPFPLPDRSVKRIASLQGEMTAMVPGRVETFEFTDLADAENVEQRKAGVAVILEQLRRNNEIYEVRVRVRFDEANNALESHRGWIYNNEAYVLDAAGERIENAGFEAYRQADNEVGVAYLFVLDDGPKNCKFVYKTPALIVRTTVKYELKDIDLP